ncbi:glucosamine inositolphosphorylceramide transferase family protein [Methylobacterium nodulans]|uniref:Glucosamine inositolphosphorylceramide transferase 1 N-terminal domain-containing protein n=1 Tax=Methylobacterium nodulans (strain LMG 21967 / CNCM I-2342 / ORS 2060) TaxID=460265 RepID=B8IHE3_METNO|nr:hypothetical protein [Methylobacterium nodulans]ACL61606.1 conserved hypothetical protein [Methylobacterium nodulans ORS 2060]
MRVCFHLDPSRLFRWHLWLAESLAAVPGCEVSCTFASERHPLPRACRLVFELERLIYRFCDGGAVDVASAAALPAEAGWHEPFDVLIDFATQETIPPSRRVLRPLFNGVPGEIGIVAALLDSQSFRLDVYDTDRPQRPWTAHPAVRDRRILAAGLDAVLSCAVELLTKVVREPPGASAGMAPGRAPTTVPVRAISVLTHAMGTVATKTVRLLGLLASGGETWTVGWRFDCGSSLLDQGQAEFRVLPGDARRYFADPFPFEHGGEHYLFMEEYPYRSGRGCIAVAKVDRTGIISPPRTVLEEPYHLSYPFVFEHDGQIWMIPESGAAKTVTLYRADPFPDRWTREATLLEGIEGYDATLLPERDQFWLFVNPKLWRSTSWDLLALFHADRLTGPWIAHRNNPVLLNACYGRSAGAIFERDGYRYRPVQDCSRGYGGAVMFCRIHALTDIEFTQTPIGRMECGSFGCHTYNRRSGLEVIDLFRSVRSNGEVTASYRPLTADGSSSPDQHGTHLGVPLLGT